MISKWYELKPKAVKLRLKGNSIKDIEKLLNIPRSTLSDWFKNVKLTEVQKDILNQRMCQSLAKSRIKAIAWHNLQKQNRLLKAQNEASDILKEIDFKNKNIIEIALAMLYLGEGSKKNSTSLGNTNPLILNYFIGSIKILYGIKDKQIKCELHLRSDQNKEDMIGYWSKELNIPKVQISAVCDKRLAKSKTYPSYKGVCVVRCGRVDILRRLGFIAEGFCTKIHDTGRLAQW